MKNKIQQKLAKLIKYYPERPIIIYMNPPTLSQGVDFCMNRITDVYLDSIIPLGGGSFVSKYNDDFMSIIRLTAKDKDWETMRDENGIFCEKKGDEFISRLPWREVIIITIETLTEEEELNI